MRVGVGVGEGKDEEGCDYGIKFNWIWNKQLDKKLDEEISDFLRNEKMKTKKDEGVRDFLFCFFLIIFTISFMFWKYLYPCWNTLGHFTSLKLVTSMQNLEKIYG